MIRRKHIIRILLAVAVLGIIGYLLKVGDQAKLAAQDTVAKLELIDLNSSKRYEVKLEEYDQIEEYFEKLTLLPILSLPFGGGNYNLRIQHGRGQIQAFGITDDHIISLDDREYRIILNKNDKAITTFISELDKVDVTYK